MSTQIFIIITTLVAVSYCQTVEFDLANPQVNPEKCGRYKNKKSYICDPDLVLTRKEADHLDWVLDSVYNNDTKCLCSAYDCETNKQGTIVTLAILSQMKRSKSADKSTAAKLNDAKNFLDNLQSEKWNLGRCDNDVIILYIADEKIIYTLTGITPKYVLTPKIIGEITDSYQQYIYEGELAAALYHMIIDYRNVLQGGRYFAMESKSQEPRGGSTQPVWSIASLLTILIGYYMSA